MRAEAEPQSAAIMNTLPGPRQLLPHELVAPGRPLRAGQATAQEATVALRWLIPFIRVTRADPRQIQALAREGVTLADFARPDCRIPHRVAIALLSEATQLAGDPCLGLHAGEHLEPGDLDVLELAARSCANLRKAITCLNRYVRIAHSALRAELIEGGGRAIWRLSSATDVPEPCASNEFALVAAYSFARHYTGRRGIACEVHLRHSVAADPREYARVFDGAEIKLGMRQNALVFASGELDLPMRHAHPGLQAAFELHAATLLERLKRRESVLCRVRELTIEQLSVGDVSMPSIARKLGMSVATLRRRLQEEGTSHSEIVDDVRRKLCEQYLGDVTLSIGEIVSLLGFSHVAAFYKAFRRWSQGVTPARFRAQLCGRDPLTMGRCELGAS